MTRRELMKAAIAVPFYAQGASNTPRSRMRSHDLGKGIPMRKLMILPLAGLLALGVVGPVAAAPNTSNMSGSGQIGRASCRERVFSSV